MFVYDVNNPASFNSLTEWISECRRHSVSSTDDTPHILIGNKCDLSSETRIKTDIAQVYIWSLIICDKVAFHNVFLPSYGFA